MRIVNSSILNFKSNKVFNTFSSFNKDRNYEGIQSWATPNEEAKKNIHKQKSRIKTNLVQNPPAKNHIDGIDIATAGGIGAGIIGVITAIKNPQKIAKLKNNAQKFVSKFSGTTKLQKMELPDISLNGKILNDIYKEGINTNYIKRIVDNAKLPIGQKHNPLNGIMIKGTDSIGKRNFFDWVLDEFKKTGIEIVDTTVESKGHSDYMSIVNGLDDIFSRRTPEAFQKDGQYSLFVVKGLDKIAQERPNQRVQLLKGKTSNCCKDRGIILLYDTNTLNNVAPPVYRTGRIDTQITPTPLDNEPLKVWKKFLSPIKEGTSSIPWAIRNIENAKRAFTKRGEDVLNEMKEYLHFTIPFQSPKINDSMDMWKKYITQSQSELTHKQLKLEFTDAIHRIREDIILDNKNTKYEHIKQMMTDCFDGDEKIEMDKLLKIYVDKNGRVT